MLTEPYVMGIFGMVFSFEVINIMFDYQMHVLMSIETSNHVGAMSSFMFFYTGSFQALSLLFALFGTSALLKRFGVQRCLFVMPFITMFLALLPVLYPHLSTLFIVMVILRALNYGFSHPIREILFIPTVKDIQFKSKAWLDSFGRTFSKTTGSTFNMLAITQTPYFCIALESAFSFGLAVIWAIIALFLGRKYTKTIEENTVIGPKA
jgi:AAA family ATP:ADP antiporter